MVGKQLPLSYGEIDLIMRDGEYLIFVEVRARKSKAFGGALASITTRNNINYLKPQRSIYLKKNYKINKPLALMY